jgi:DnaJ-class molecular chaperone
MAKRDYYDVLGVSRTATESEIKQAFRRLAKKLHPDRNRGDKTSEAKFKETQEAYATLSDRQKRATYDQFGHVGPESGFGGGRPWGGGGGGVPIDLGDLADMFDLGSGGRGVSSDPGSVFESIFGGAAAGARGRPRRQPPAAQDVETPVTLTFEQAVRGVTLDLALAHGLNAKQRIAVTIPPGVRHGQKIRVRGKGQPGRGGRPDGDLYVACNVRLHAYFERQGDDIYVTVPITITEAALGAKVDIPTLDGTRTVTVPPGTPSGAKLRLAGLGVENPKEAGRGDQYAVLKIVPPKSLDPRQREILEELRTSESTPREGLWT